MSIPGKEILRSYDEHGPIQVFDDGNKRHLAFGTDDEQGCILKTQPWQVQYDYIRAMMLSLLFSPSPQNCLLFGLGSGALANGLFNHLPEVELTVVELRGKVIELAHSHFYLPKHHRIHLIQQDAGNYIENCEQTFDLILSDIYNSDGMHLQQTQLEFLEDCARQLNAGGWLVLNLWQEHRSSQLVPELKELFNQVWVTSIDSGNWIVLASLTSHTLSRKQIKQRAKNLSKELGFSMQKVAANLQCLN